MEKRLALLFRLAAVYEITGGAGMGCLRMASMRWVARNVSGRPPYDRSSERSRID